MWMNSYSSARVRVRRRSRRRTNIARRSDGICSSRAVLRVRDLGVQPAGQACPSDEANARPLIKAVQNTLQQVVNTSLAVFGANDALQRCRIEVASRSDLRLQMSTRGCAQRATGKNWHAEALALAFVSSPSERTRSARTHDAMGASEQQKAYGYHNIRSWRD